MPEPSVGSSFNGKRSLSRRMMGDNIVAHLFFCTTRQQRQLSKVLSYDQLEQAEGSPYPLPP